jgi:hypothetical protein
MTFLSAAIAANIAGKVGELKTPKETGSPEFKKRQAVREYNALLDRTDPSEPGGSPSIKCLSSEKATRRKNRHDLIRKTQNNTTLETDPAKKKKMLETTDRLAKDMDRVEDAKLSLHAYTANEDEAKQETFLKPLRNQPPPGFKNASLDQMAEDFGVDADKLQDIVRDKDNPSQKIMIYERDPEVLGPGPKYTIAFRGSTQDERDWNNNGRNEAGFEAPHQKNAARLGEFLEKGASKQGKSLDGLISATGHSKGGSEAQAFAAASGSSARVFNPAGFDPKQYAMTKHVTPDEMHIDRTTVIEHDNGGKLIKSTKLEPHTDPLYYAQNKGLSRFLMKKPITNCTPREVAPIDPNLSVPSEEQSDTEAHSLFQVIEALERDKTADQETLKNYVPRT